MFYCLLRGMLLPFLLLIFVVPANALFLGDDTDFEFHIEGQNDFSNKSVNARQWLEPLSSSFKQNEWQQNLYARKLGLENIDIDPILEMQNQIQKLSLRYTTGKFEFLNTDVQWNANIGGAKNFSFNLTFYTMPQIPLLNSRTIHKLTSKNVPKSTAKPVKAD